jgi:hypothetical protein
LKYEGECPITIARGLGKPKMCQSSNQEENNVKKSRLTLLISALATLLFLPLIIAASPIGEEPRDPAPTQEPIALETIEAVVEIMAIPEPKTPSTPPTLVIEETFEPWDISLPVHLQRHTWSEAKRIGIDPEILLKLMWRESRYQADAWRLDSNGYESVGLCQINGIMLNWLSERAIDPSTPEGNITAAAEIIQYYIEDRGCSLEEALAAYGAGETGMRNGQGKEAARRLLEGALPMT